MIDFLFLRHVHDIVVAQAYVEMSWSESLFYIFSIGSEMIGYYVRRKKIASHLRSVIMLTREKTIICNTRKICFEEAFGFFMLYMYRVFIASREGLTSCSCLVRYVTQPR